MPQANIDPEEVRRFAAGLKRFNGDLRERTGLLLARITALGDTWQDQEQEKFAAEFTQLMETLESFIDCPTSTPRISCARRNASSSAPTNIDSPILSRPATEISSPRDCFRRKRACRRPR